MHQRLKAQHLLQGLAERRAGQQQDTVDTVAGGFDTLSKTPAKLRPGVGAGRLQQVQVGGDQYIVIANGSAPQGARQQGFTQAFSARRIPQGVGVWRHDASGWGGAGGGAGRDGRNG